MKQTGITIASFPRHGLATTLTSLTGLLLTISSVGQGVPQVSLSEKADVSRAIREPAKGSSANAERPGDQGNRDQATLSPGMINVLKLFKAGVSYDVIAAYIENARMPPPNADEILQLHDAGFPNNLLVSLLRPKSKSGPVPVESQAQAMPSPARTGGETKSQPTVVQSSYSQPASVVAPVYVEAPTPIYIPRPVVVNPYPSVIASYNPWPYYYASYPSFSLGYGGFRGHFRYGGGYHSGYRGYYSHPGISVGLNFRGHGHSGHFRGHGHSGRFHHAGRSHFAGSRSSYSFRGHSGHHRSMASGRRR